MIERILGWVLPVVVWAIILVIVTYAVAWAIDQLHGPDPSPQPPEYGPYATLVHTRVL